jgi:sugar phosphate isomerase/epimerase
MDVFGYLESVRYRYGLQTADIWNGLLGDNPAQYLSKDFLRKVKQALAEREMVLVNYHVDGVHIWEDDPEARESNYRNALAHLEAAEYLGAKTVRIDTGGRDLEMTPEQFDTIVSRYQEYCRLGEAGGFRVGPETHWGPELSPDNMVRIAEAVDSPAYGILLHLGHWDVGDEAENDKRVAPWTMHTHVDARITATGLEERMKGLLDAGYEGHWGVEHHTAQNEYREVAWQLASVQRALSRLQPAE